MLIKAINSLKNKEEEKPVIVQKEEVVLLAEIRDLLKK
jgi:large-conductance mechanosensitive channel